MNQRTFISNDIEQVAKFAEGVRDSSEFINAADRILLVFDTEDDFETIGYNKRRIKEVIPDIKIAGITIESGSDISDRLGIKEGAVYSFLLFDESESIIYSYRIKDEESAQNAGRDLRKKIRYRDDIAGILLFSAGVEKELELFLTRVGRDDVPVIGFQAGLGDNPCIYEETIIDRGVIAIVLAGANLQLYYNYDMGWKPIGKEMKITGTDGDFCVTTIDDKPATGIYERYLGVDADEYFVENVREFPIVTRRGSRQVVRCPSGYDEDGRMYFIARMKQGESVRLSYGNPRRLVEDTKIYAGSMRTFSPQALILIACYNRIMVLNELSSSDIYSYKSFAPDVAVGRGMTAVLKDNKGGGIVNSAFISFGFREGTYKSVRPVRTESDDYYTSAHKRGTIPLDQRLAMFLERTTDELEEMAVAAGSANEAKSDFLSNMSHEIRTPINAILGMDEMILRESESEGVNEYAKNIQVAGRNLLGIINDILDFSKIEAGKIDINPAEYKIADVMADLVNMIKLRAEEGGLSIKAFIDPMMPRMLLGDEIRIKQIVTNLLTNAVKYTEKGSVTVNAYCERTGENEIILKVAVSDTGIGIKKEDINRLFIAFERLDSKRTARIEGTGLGLVITQKLIKAMDGELKVESTYGKGSTFEASIPQKIVDATPIGDFDVFSYRMKEEKEKGQLRFVAPKARILVVDDASMNLLVITGLLKRIKSEVDVASSGQAAIDLFAKNNYNIIFMDHRMPGMDGIDTYNMMMELYPDKTLSTPVIALTANAATGAKDKYIKAGFSDYLAKPVTGEELEEMIYRFIDSDKIEMLEGDPGDDELDFDKEKEKLPAKIFEVPGLETEKGIEFCGGAEGYLEAVKIFSSSLSDKRDEIERLFEENNIKDLGLKVHTLKSTSRSIGAEKLSDLAREVEMAADEIVKAGAVNEDSGLGTGKDSRTEAGTRAETDSPIISSEFRGKFYEMLQLYSSMEEPLKSLFTEESEEAADDKPVLDAAVFKDALVSLKELAGSFDYTSVRMVMDMLREYLVPTKFMEVYNNLERAVDRADWEKITAAIAECEKVLE